MRSPKTTILHYLYYSLSISVIVNAESRYFIEFSTDTDIAVPRPLDICHENSNREFVVYSCDITDANKHRLIATNHGKDYPFCNSANPQIDYYFNNDTFNIDIEGGSFNCIGDDTYSILYEFMNEPLCRNYLDSNKKSEENDDNDSVRIIYKATNICYHHNANSVKSLNITMDEELMMFYCNGFYTESRFFEDGSNCINDIKTTLPESATAVGRVFSPNICSKDSSGVFNYSSLIMHECFINGTKVEPTDYKYSNLSLKSISIQERIGLIDWMVSTGDMNNQTFYPWAQYFCHLFNFGGWNLYEITENGNIYQSDYISPICGILLSDPGDLFTSLVDTMLSYVDNFDFISFNYSDPFKRINSNPLNKTIIYGLNFSIDYDINIGGSIPDTICKLNNLQFLQINAYKSMYGTIPECIGNELDVHRLQLVTLENITGTIPESLCNIQQYTLFWLINLRNLTGTIPQCFGDLNMNYRSLQIWRNEKLIGTLPENMFCGYDLVNFNFHNNSNMSSQTIPSCWSETRSFLMWVSMPYSKLKGVMPKFPKVDYAPFAWLEIHGNKLEGTVSDIFEDMQSGKLVDGFEEYTLKIKELYKLLGQDFNIDLSFKLLQVFMIHDNLFEDDDISSFLESIFSENTRGITVFSLSNNKYISGTIPDLSNFTIKDSGLNRKWTALLLHNLDLYGTIPSEMKLGGIDYLTLHNNRLSGYIPDDFKDIPTNPNITTSSIVLLGNLLWTDNLTPPQWVNSPLRTASNMYYNPLQQAEGIMVVIIGFLGIFIGILYCLKPYIFEQKLFFHQEQLFEKKLPIILFFDTMQTLRQLFAKENVILFIATLILIIFYSITSKYYYVVPHESIFALPWYWIDPRNESILPILGNIFLIIMAILYNWLLLRLVNDINGLNKQTKKEMKANKIEFKTQLKLKMQSEIELEIMNGTPINSDGDDEEIAIATKSHKKELPNGWRIGYTNDGRLYYINDITKETQWSKPVALPNGWDIRYTADNKLYYQNNKTKQTQWERPEILQPLSKGWQEVYTVDGRVYYQNHTTKETQWERPTEERKLNEIENYEHKKDDNNNNNIDDDIDDDVALEVMAEKRWKSALKLIFYFILWIIGMFIIIIYILSSSLPDDNALGWPSWLIQVIAKLLSLILVLYDIFIIPGLASGISATCCDGIKGKYQIILILRLINEIILPFIGSLFLLQECGRYWVQFWTLCTDDTLKSQHFDIVLENADKSYTTLLESDDVCGEKGLTEIEYNKCLRHFLYNWTAVMMAKLVIGVIVQIISFLLKLRKHKKQQKIIKNIDKREKKKGREIKIHIDGQYMSITMNLLISIAFSFCAPMIIAINLFGIFIKSYLFKKERYEYKWKFDIKFAANDQTLPVRFLWIGIAINQLFTLLFCLWSLDDGYIYGILIGLGLLIIDIYLIRKKCIGDDVIFLRERWDERDNKKTEKKDVIKQEPTFIKQVTVYDYNDYWKCEICTMINENKMANCKMCNNPHITSVKMKYPNLNNKEKEILPNGWTSVIDKNGKKYYQNDITKETQWIKPTQSAATLNAPKSIAVPSTSYDDIIEWKVMYNNDGRKYYQNNITKETSWRKPNGFKEEKEEKEEEEEFEEEEEEIIPIKHIAASWSVMYTDKGRKYYQNDITKETQWTKPINLNEGNEISSAAAPQLVKGWSIMYTNDGRMYYQNDITKETSWRKPDGYTQQQQEQKKEDKDDAPPSLPKGWSIKFTNDGEKYYQNDITKTTSWELPKKLKQKKDEELPLPDGWSKLYSNDGKVYYQDNKTKKTQWIHPTEKNFGWMIRYTNDGKNYYQNEITKETQWNKPNQFKD